MSLILVCIVLVALVATVFRLLRLVAGDGYGSTPAPRSHVEELGSWVDRELRR